MSVLAWEAVVDALIPGDQPRGLSSASVVVGRAVDRLPDDVDHLRNLCAKLLLAESAESIIGSIAQGTPVQKSDRETRLIIAELTETLLEIYMTDDCVQIALGINAPFMGRILPDFDYELLTPVYERGAIYRSVK